MVANEHQEITTFRALGSIRKPANQQCCSSHSRPKEQFNSACGDAAGGGFSPFKFLGCLPLPRFTTIRMSEHSVPQKLIADWFTGTITIYIWRYTPFSNTPIHSTRPKLWHGEIIHFGSCWISFGWFAGLNAQICTTRIHVIGCY